MPDQPPRARLGVNVDHVATLRQARGTRYPDPVHAALLAESAGADQITVHLREDRRHIQERDVRVLRETVQTVLNLEMAATDEMVRVALDVWPDVVTLVPERREERTTEGGLDAVGGGAPLASAVKTLREAGIEVSLFIDSDAAQVDASVALGAHAIELHTGDYCLASDTSERVGELQALLEAARRGHEHGLRVAAGHGLDHRNILDVAAIDLIEEFNVGHSIVARSVFIGFEAAVRELLDAMAAGRARGSAASRR